MTTATPVVASSDDAPAAQGAHVDPPAQEPKAKKSRTNTPWTPAEEQRLKTMRDAGNSWSEIAKVEIHGPREYKHRCKCCPIGREGCGELPKLTRVSSQ